MAEAALFSVASKILSTVASPAFEMAYDRACSVWDARDELDKLKLTIATIQAVLLDAERRQCDSEAVKIWLKRVKDVMYDVDDLFDEVSADDMLRKQMKGNKVVKKVWVSCSRLNLVVFNDSIAKKVKFVRKCLQAISKDMKMFNFAVCQDDKLISRMREGRDPGSFVDSKSVFGRDRDKEAIVGMLLDESNHDVGVMAIVGIGGMGKTTLTQLIYNDKKVEMHFEKRWFACISDSSTDIEVFGKIFQSIDKTDRGNFSLSILQNKIKESINGKKFLLVLDDVWDDDRARWQNRMGLLSSGAKGSLIIVSTRSEVVARALGAFKSHILCGLSEEDSWELFKCVVGLSSEQEKDLKRIHLGRDIVKKCANVPLAIKSIGSLLFERNTIQEWELIRNEELPHLGDSYQDNVMPVLKLSYEYLPSNLKHCFAYCSLFPKDYKFHEEELVNLWIAQGYISQSNMKQVIEDIGHSYFMDLCRRSFFQLDDFDKCYRMHDLIHDLAIHVSGDEISQLSNTSSSKVTGIRHASLSFVADLYLLESLLSANRLRSLLFMTPSQQIVELSDCKYLRALKVAELGMENLPSCIGELKHLRYLDISCNNFKELPDSITKLVNLCTLKIKNCRELELLPSSFGKLVSLRHLNNVGCVMLKHMPVGFKELTRLQSLNEFRVCKDKNEGQTFRIDGLSQLKLRGALKINFEKGADDWDGIDSWQPPLFLEELRIFYYTGIRIPNLENGMAAKLTSLHVVLCPNVKCLPSLKYLPNIKILNLYKLEELEYIAEEEEEGLFIPDLERLKIRQLPKLKAWSRKECSKSLFPCLTHLNIYNCPELISLPLCPSLERLKLLSTRWKQIEELKLLTISDTATSSSSLVHVTINDCYNMVSFPGKSLTSLRHLEFWSSKKLKKVELPPLHLNNLEELTLWGCPELELWEENKTGVDWVSLIKLRRLMIDRERVPSSERLPNCLQHLQQLGKLEIFGE